MNKEIKFGRNAVKKSGSARLQIKPNSFLISLFTICFILASIYHFTKTHQDTKFSLTFPVKCQLEINCIIQHLPDLDPGEGVKDPFGDVNTFNNHNGLDIRVISVEAMNKGVDIVAAADGIVIKKSDILPDRFLRTKAEMRIAQKNRCGNYIVISHQEGFETIYCQLKQNSVVVEAGDKVSAGETIANLGYSGFARWPHLHFTLKKNGKWIDAIFGNEPGIPIANNTESLFEDKYLASLNNAGLRLLGSGISSRKVSLYDLNSNGHPKNAELTRVRTY